MNASAAIGEGGAVAGAPVYALTGVSKTYARNQVVALQDVSLTLGEGSFTSVIGSSGCGKSTLLKIMAGLIPPTAGRVVLQGEPVTGTRRDIGMMFQQATLFPWRTTIQNVVLPIEIRDGRTAAERAKDKARELLDIVGLAGFEDVYPNELSGGMAQRASICRMLITEPAVLLLDEPFSALDAKLRATMQVELRQLIKRLGLTAIFVTHDQEEALTMSDRIAVMRDGGIEQVDTPDMVFDRPASAYVADFIGSSNFWPAEARGGRVTLPDGQALATDLGGRVRVMARPHNIALTPEAAGSWRGRVAFHRTIGALVEYHVETEGGATLQVAAMRRDRAGAPVPGAEVSLSVIDPAACAVYPA